jgi:hypothetical protein
MKIKTNSPPMINKVKPMLSQNATEAVDALDAVDATEAVAAVAATKRYQKMS